MIQPSNLYEWTINQLTSDNLSTYEQDKILNNLQSLEFVREKFKNWNGMYLVNMYNQTLTAMQDGSLPPDLMSWSAMYYNFTKKGLNTKEMKQEINSNTGLKNEVEKMIK